MATHKPGLPRAAAVVSEIGQVRLTLPIHPNGVAPDIGVLVDGAFEGLARPASVSSVPTPGVHSFSADLPRHRMVERLDLVDIRTGRSVLAQALDLRSHYAFALTKVEVRDGKVSGAFRLAGWVGPAIMVELVRDGVVLAQAAALRAPSEDAGIALYPFALRPGFLIPIEETASLSLRIGGSVAAAVMLTAADLGYTGYLDKFAGTAQGWAVDLSDPRKQVAIDIRINGVVLATANADAPRPDVRTLGIKHDRCGFSLALPAEFGGGRGFELSAVLAGTDIHLCNSPINVPARPTLQGYLDKCHGTSVHGWALSRLQPKTPLLVEAVLPDGRVLGQAEAKLFRGDLLNAGLADGMCAFKIDLGQQFLDLLGQSISVRVAGTTEVLRGSPKMVELNPNLVRFARRRNEVAPKILPRLKRRLNHAAGALGVSIVMPVYNTAQAWLIEAIESVYAQWCDRWELICVNDASTEPHVAQILAVAAQGDSRIRVLNAPSNGGIAAATNYGIRAARFEYIAFMDHDDTIEPDAVWQLIRAAKRTDADFLYSDEATTDQNIAGVSEVRCRPAFSYDYYLSHPYFVHMLCVRASIARRIGGWDEDMAVSADVDFVLRVLEHARNVVHVPAVLYRWRTHESSAGHQSHSRVMDATRGALQRHLDRCGTGAVAQDGIDFNQFRIDWPKTDGQVLIVIPTKNKVELLRTAVESIERTAAGVDYRIVVIDHESTDPATRRYLDKLARTHTVMPYYGKFNFPLMNNLAVSTHGAGAEFVLFLNNDVEALQDGWLDRMRRLANRKDVGCVGALLLYADRRVQHAGVILGFNGSADHALKFNEAFLDGKERRNLGYNCSLASVRDFSAVTAACLMMRRSVFEAMGGFDEAYAIGFNDTDLCLRLRQQGLKVLYDGATMLFHYESATRSETKQILHQEDTKRLLTQWAGILRDGDPFYSPILSDRVQDHVLREEPGCRTAHQPRVTRIDLGRQAAAVRPSEPAQPPLRARLNRPARVLAMTAPQNPSRRR